MGEGQRTVGNYSRSDITDEPGYSSITGTKAGLRMPVIGRRQPHSHLSHMAIILERRKPIAVKPAITKDSSASAHWLSEGTAVGVGVGVAEGLICTESALALH